jgi:hypothetical protein
MKIRYLSCLHYQAAPWKFRHETAALIAEPADVCVVTGDFFPGMRSSVAALGKLSEAMPIIMVPGNLDFYNATTDMEDLLDEARQQAQAFPSLHVLYDDAVVIGDTRFIGTTMWAKLDDEEAYSSISRLADFEHIRTRRGRWSVDIQNDAHDVSRAFVETELARDDGLTTVVATHLYPHPKVVSKIFEGSPLNQFFVNDFDALMHSDIAPDYWLHGSAIDPVDMVIGKTRVLSNARGLPLKALGPFDVESIDKNENERFDFNASFTTEPTPTFKPAGA